MDERRFTHQLGRVRQTYALKQKSPRAGQGAGAKPSNFMRDKDTSPADHLRDYFTHDIGPVLNYSALETQLKVPHKTLRYWAKSTYPRPLPEIHREKVLRWARQHGYSETIQYDSIV